MDDARNSEIEKDAGTQRNSMRKRIAIFGTVLLATFLLGFIPMWLTARVNANERDTAQQNLRLSQMQNRLATSTIFARRGEYEQARTAASDFFTELRAEIDRENNAFNKAQREAMQPILEQRDETITLLARSDPASADRLADLYLTYLQTINFRITAEAATVSRIYFKPDRKRNR